MLFNRDDYIWSQVYDLQKALQEAAPLDRSFFVLALPPSLGQALFLLISFLGLTNRLSRNAVSNSLSLNTGTRSQDLDLLVERD